MRAEAADTRDVEPDTDRIARLKTLGEALDRARIRAEELCTLLADRVETPASDPRDRPDSQDSSVFTRPQNRR